MKKRAAYLGVFTALAMILSYIETLIPMFYGMPGVKPGLANSMTLIILYLAGAPSAFLVLLARIVLSGLMFGNLFAILYSLAGGIFSFFVMLLAKKSRACSMIGVSMAGGIAHNAAQLAVAILLVENEKLIYYLPVLLISGVVTGILTGFVGREVLRRLPSDLFQLRK